MENESIFLFINAFVVTAITVAIVYSILHREYKPRIAELERELHAIDPRHSSDQSWRDET